MTASLRLPSGFRPLDLPPLPAGLGFDPNPSPRTAAGAFLRLWLADNRMLSNSKVYIAVYFQHKRLAETHAPKVSVAEKAPPNSAGAFLFLGNTFSGSAS